MERCYNEEPEWIMCQLLVQADDFNWLGENTDTKNYTQRNRR
jgi:hypothetical protein